MRAAAEATPAFASGPAGAGSTGSWPRSTSWPSARADDQRARPRHKAIGRDGRLDERARPEGLDGTWLQSIDAVNSMIADLARPTVEVARVLDAVARGDLSQKIDLTIEGRPIKGEFRRMGRR